MRNPEVLKSYLEAVKRHWPQLHVPHLIDEYGCSPLKRALKLNNRRVVAWFLKLLQGYPQGYCTEQIAHCLTKLLSTHKNFECRVGEYMDARFFEPCWSRDYEVGPLILNESGYNQTTTNYFPIDKTNID